MDIEKVGAAIAYLRKRAGYTQKDLADRIGISDKAVSKWERGLGLPDVSLLGKLSLLLDTDTDSLLAGDVIHHDKGWNGLLVFDDNPYGIGADTIIYDKPLVYYMLSYFILVGIKNIKIICDERNQNFIQNTLVSGGFFSFSISFGRSIADAVTDETFCNCDNLMVVFRRSFIYGVDMTRFLQRAMVHKDRLTILALPQGTRDVEDAVRFDANKKIVSSEDDDQLTTQYNYYNIPILFCPLPMFAEHFQHNPHNNNMSSLLNGQDVYIEALDRGFIEITISTQDDLFEAANMVRLIEKHCGMIIYCLEEVAWRRGMISKQALLAHSETINNPEYKKYVLSFVSSPSNSSGI